MGSIIDEIRFWKRQEDEIQKREGKFKYNLVFDIFDIGKKREREIFIFFILFIIMMKLSKI